MPRFFFDVFDGDTLWSDPEGTIHADLPTARQEAIETLTSMSREIFPHERAFSLSVDIRPEGEQAFERIVITLSFQTL